jgi:hypothetical protein
MQMHVDGMTIGVDPARPGGDNTVVVKVDVDGTLHFIWSDELIELLEAGRGEVRRASHVEPTDRGLWGADLSPVDGPLLGPFRTRREALDAERIWLLENYLGVTH